MSQENRRAALEGFKKQLQQKAVDNDIVLIPDEFEVQETRYSPIEATVLVREKFKQRDFTELKRFTYYLTRRDRIWLITGYETFNLGTE